MPSRINSVLLRDLSQHSSRVTVHHFCLFVCRKNFPQGRMRKCSRAVLWEKAMSGSAADSAASACGKQIRLGGANKANV